MKVFLADLNTIRIRCNKCGLLMELEISQVDTLLSQSQCQCLNCHANFLMPGRTSPQGSSPLHHLALALFQLDAMKAHFQIEFPVKIVK